MSATTLVRRTATVLTAAAIALPAFGALGGAAFAAQPATHGKGKATVGASTHAHRHAAAAKSPAPRKTHATSSATTSPTTPSSKSDPRGNNGTVFIHDVAGDNRPRNVPHVGCTFYVDFFGFDGDQVLSTTFVAQAPTAAGTPLPSGDWTGTMPADGAGGAGRDFDAEQAFTLDTSALGAPQAQQGYHVKLTVSTGEPGGVKHKVFWISDCAQPTTATRAVVPPAPQVNAARTERASQVLGLTVRRQLPAGVTRVLAVSADRTPSVLPFTGAAGIGVLLAIAGGVLAAGGVLVTAGRVRGVSR